MPGPNQPMPPGPQPSPAGAAPQGGDPSQAGGGSASSLLVNIDKGIDLLSQMINQSKATSPQEKQLIGMVDEAFGKLMDSLGQGQGAPDSDDQDSGAQGQTVSPEAAGNPNAVPSRM